jgi:hypothetical protein
MGCGGSQEQEKHTVKEVAAWLRGMKEEEKKNPDINFCESAEKATPHDVYLNGLRENPEVYMEAMKTVLEEEHGPLPTLDVTAAPPSVTPPLYFNNRTLMTRMEGRDFNIQTPANLAELRQVMTAAVAAGQTLRAMGTQYAFDDVAMADNVAMIDMITHLNSPKLNDSATEQSALRSLLNPMGQALLDKDHLWKSEAGTFQQQITEKAWPMDEAGAKMNPPQRTTVWKDKATGSKYTMLQCLAGYHQLSMGGTINVAAQGQGGGKAGALQNQVRSFHLLSFDADKNLIERQIEPSTGGIYNKAAWDAYMLTQPLDERVELVQDDEVFNAALVSCGTFGIVYSYDLELMDAVMLKEDRFMTTWNDFKKKYPGYLATIKDDSLFRMEVTISPYHVAGASMDLAVLLMWKLPDDAPVTPLEEFGILHSQTLAAGYLFGALPVLASHKLWSAVSLGFILYEAIKATCHAPGLVADAVSLLSLGCPCSVPAQVAGIIVSQDKLIAAVETWSKLFNTSWDNQNPCTSPAGITWCGEAAGYIGMNSGLSSAWIECPYPDYTSKVKGEVWNGEEFPPLSRLGATKNWQNSIEQINLMLTDPKYGFNGRMHLGLSQTKVFFNKAIWQNKAIYPDFGKYLRQYKIFNVSRAFSSDFTRSTDLDELAFGN